MAKKSVMVVVCDKCGTDGTDVSKFRHVTVAEIPPLESKGKMKVVSTKDLCLKCIGAPGVNVEP